MAKGKSDNKKKKEFANKLRIQDWLKDRKFLGKNGRFGMVDKMWKDFTFDELAEFARSHNEATIKKHLIGAIPPDYIGPWDQQPLPIKPENEETGE